MDVKKGDVILMDAGVEHEFATEKDERITLCNCLFYPEFLTRVITGDNFIDLAYDMFFSGYEDERGAKGYLCLLGADTSEIGRLVLTMVDEQEKKQEGYLKVIRSLLSVVLIKTFRLCESENRPTIPSAQRKIVSEIIDYVTAHDSKSLSVGVISHAMFFSPSYLSRIFKQQTGKSLVSFIPPQSCCAPRLTPWKKSCSTWATPTRSTFTRSLPPPTAPRPASIAPPAALANKMTAILL